MTYLNSWQLGHLAHFEEMQSATYLTASVRSLSAAQFLGQYKLKSLSDQDRLDWSLSVLFLPSHEGKQHFECYRTAKYIEDC